MGSDLYGTEQVRETSNIIALQTSMQAKLGIFGATGAL